MDSPLSRLSDDDLRGLLYAIRVERLRHPFPELQLREVIPGGSCDIANELRRLTELCFSRDQIAALLELMLADRDQRPGAVVDVVTSGPETPDDMTRDTAVVVRELFAHARSSVMVAGYTVRQGDRVFETLARRMVEVPDLQVDLHIEIGRNSGDSTPSSVLVSRFGERFREKEWPRDCPLPRVWYDPRSLASPGNVRSSLHAKCVVIDVVTSFVSSANFTEAGQQRNIEVGVLINSLNVAERLHRHFSQLRQHDRLERAF